MYAGALSSSVDFVYVKLVEFATRTETTVCSLTWCVERRQVVYVSRAVVMNERLIEIRWHKLCFVLSQEENKPT